MSLKYIKTKQKRKKKLKVYVMMKLNEKKGLVGKSCIKYPTKTKIKNKPHPSIKYTQYTTISV